MKNLLEIIQFYGEKQELAKKAGITFLTDMGFEKNASEMALLAGRNNINAAIEWICENHFDKAAEIQKPQESLILKKILESPTLQKSLGDPILFHGWFNILIFILFEKAIPNGF